MEVESKFFDLVQNVSKDLSRASEIMGEAAKEEDIKNILLSAGFVGRIMEDIWIDAATLISIRDND